MRAGNIALVTGPLKKRWVLATVGMKKGDLITNTAKEIVGGLSQFLNMQPF